MSVTPLVPTIATHRPWLQCLADLARERLAARRLYVTPLRELDARALADIGVHASEIDSIQAEALGPQSGITRRRIVAVIEGT